MFAPRSSPVVVLAVSLVALLALGGASTASATVLEARTLAQLIDRADRVDIGVVESRRSLQVRDDIGLMETRVRVERTLLGAPKASLAVTQLGGEADGTATELVGDARLVPGERFLLITWLAPDGRRYLVSMGLGAFVVDGTRVSQEVDAAIQRPDGALVPGPFRRAVRVVDVERAVRARGTP